MVTTTDAKVAELFDRTYHALPESIRGTWSCSGDGDPWGDAMSHAFALNDVAQLAELPTDPTYRPGCGLSWETIDDDWPSAMYADDYHAGIISDDDMATAIRVMGTLCHALEMLGLSY